ncbi:hypothetical protein [Kitasatospora sp. DSM 101779]|uniref:hypothetical protein n=1 Tax=Kitasatospora sp. DSM 101779 TaxID=2853165 RepID=UPI0021DB773A|nr:hypothetical protein [Kitasatospora sp. DSM 101779]MCU7827092.1 hypothetical protein [Kitasatospora sp. DSM 101779]
MLALTGWVGGGRRLTTTGQLLRGDARELVELLGTGGNQAGAGLAAPLRGVQVLLAWAHLSGLVRTDGSWLGPGPAAARLREDPGALRDALFAAVPRLEDSRCGWQSVRLHLDGAPDFSEGLVALWRRLGAGPSTEEEAARVVWDELTAHHQVEERQPEGLTSWKVVVARDVGRALGLYEAVGAVQFKGGQFEGGRFELTGYGRERELSGARDDAVAPHRLGEAFVHWP